MGLENFVTEPQRARDKEKFQRSELCPDCGEEGEHLRGNEYRCTTDREKCSTVTWISNDYEIDYAKV